MIKLEGFISGLLTAALVFYGSVRPAFAIPYIDYDYKVHTLPGTLDSTPIINRNSPDMIKSEAILLSTFPPADKARPEAHQNMSFRGRFDIFTHHIAVEREKGDFTNLFQ